MKTILALMLLFLVNVSAAPLSKVGCQDQYRHCPEWSKAGYCHKAGYNTYMTLMCAYSCDTCKDIQQSKESEGEPVASGSGSEDAGQLDNPSDIEEAPERGQDEASGNEPISGDGEIHGDGNSYGNKEDHQVDKLQSEQSKDAALESQNNAQQSKDRQQRQSTSEEKIDNKDVGNKQKQDKKVADTQNQDPKGAQENKGNQDVTRKQQMQDKNVGVAQDRDPPGVHLVKFQDNNVDDALNPRSKISTRPKENPSVNYKPLSETKVQNKEITEKQDEDVSASGSMLDGSGEGEGDQSKSANAKASGESEEMKDIAGDIKTGSKIFESDISEPDSISGCSSGFGCFSGNGEGIQAEKSEETVELETRSKIATVPQVKAAKSQQTDKNVEIVHGQTSPDRETASGTDTVVQGDIPSNGEDEGSESDDIAGDKSVADSKVKIASPALGTPEEHFETTKNDDEEEKIANEKASPGSGADVKDDIQGQSVHGDKDESIDDGGKSGGKSDAFSGSGSDTKSESQKEVQNAPKSDAESINVNEQKHEQSTTAKSEQVDKKESLANSAAKNSDMNSQSAAAKSTSSDQNQSPTKTNADNEETKTEKDNIKNEEVDEQKVVKDTAETKPVESQESDEDEDKETHGQGATKDTTDSKPKVTQSGANVDADNEEVDGEKDVKGIAETKPDESQKSEVDKDAEEMPANQDVTKNTNEFKPNDKNSEAKGEEEENDKQGAAEGDEENLELNGQKDVKEASAPNDGQNGKKNKEAEGNNDVSSGPEKASIDTDQSIDDDEDKGAGIDGTTSETKTSDTEENDMEDALDVKDDLFNDNKGSGGGSGQPEQENNADLSTAANRQRINSMEQLIKDEKPTPEKETEAPAKTRENVPSPEETPDDFINTDLGKGQRVKLILDQHYYKPYSNEDSMAYEMLALDLKKEVERAVGNQAIVSQISFSEIQKPGRLPRYSRVLATFMLHGDKQALHRGVRKGLVGDLMVDKEFFQSS